MIPSREWKALVEDGKEKGLRKAGKIPLGTLEVCNTFHNVMVSLIIINFYIEFGTSTNVIQCLIRLLDTSKATKARL